MPLSLSYTKALNYAPHTVCYIIYELCNNTLFFFFFLLLLLSVTFCFKLRNLILGTSRYWGSGRSGREDLCRGRIWWSWWMPTCPWASNESLHQRQPPASWAALGRVCGEQLKGGDPPPQLSPGETHLECQIQECKTSQYERNVDLLE